MNIPNPVRVVVAGATGKMGREVVKAVTSTEDMELVGAVALEHTGSDVGKVVGIQELGVHIATEVVEVLDQTKPHVLVDFTAPKVAGRNTLAALERGVRAVVGTTAIPREEIERIVQHCESNGTAAAIIPNFCIGAVLLMKVAEEVAPFFDKAEIIELHHDQKLDAPSGTSLRIEERIAKGSSRRSPIHSIRLPGLVAHHEVIFGRPGETLILRHDSINREAFMPGVLKTIRKVMKTRGMITNLEEVLFEREDT